MGVCSLAEAVMAVSEDFRLVQTDDLSMPYGRVMTQTELRVVTHQLGSSYGALISA